MRDNCLIKEEGKKRASVTRGAVGGGVLLIAASWLRIESEGRVLWFCAGSGEKKERGRVEGGLMLPGACWRVAGVAACVSKA